MEGVMERPRNFARGRPPLAATRRCCLLLSQCLGSCIVSIFDFDVRFGHLARLSLLLRSRDVGYRDLLRPAVDISAARSRRSAVGISFALAERRSQQRPDFWPAGPPIPLGVGSPVRPGGRALAGDGGMA